MNRYTNLRNTYKTALYVIAGLVLLAEVITQVTVNDLEATLLAQGIEPSDQLYTLRVATYGVGLMILAVLPFLAYGFFRPVVNTIERQVAEIESQNRRLKETEEQMRTALQKQLETTEKLLLARQELEEKNRKLQESEQQLLQLMDEQLAAGEELYRTQRQLKEAFAIGKLGAWSFEAKGEEAYLTLTDEYYQILGTNAEAEGGYRFNFMQWMQRFVLPEDHAHVLEKLSAALNSDEFEDTVEFRVRRADTGDIRYTRTTAYAKRNPQTGVITGGGVIQDITEQHLYNQRIKESEEQMRELLEQTLAQSEELLKTREELESLLKKEQESKKLLEENEEQMRELLMQTLEQSEQLLKTREELERALKEEQETKQKLEVLVKQLQEAQTKLIQSEKMASLGVLTAGIAHEINNPINFVYNGIDTLRMLLQDMFEVVDAYEALHPLKADYQQLLAQLEKVEALKEEIDFEEVKEDIHALVGDIAKGASRTMEIVKGLRTFSRLDEEERKVADIHEGIDSTLILLQNKYKNRIEIKKYYDPELKPFAHYPGQLNQVFMNLISNAIQAIPEERTDGKIEIYTEDKQENVVIRIKDNGVGIPEDKLQRIFEPFFTTKPVGVGTGLGLAIVHSIIDKHGGQIEVHSEVGKGTEFIIVLPKHEV
ncbi:ATP-binding protein [Thermonema rossianum]|uniref:ATP-binding protein n=1 Tax=Thermonema rossianum TaxID=55505 RepID=UPI00068DCDA5|nr:ATP-binding protein [Thermonema rossianum]